MLELYSFDLLLFPLHHHRSVFFIRSKLQSKVNFKSEELNQYYLAAELMDDIEGNSTKMHTELNENPAKFRIRRTYLPQDNYLTDLSEELNQAIISCVEQHQMLIEFSKMMEDFFSVFVLLKSFQTTFQICNLVFTFLKVSQWNLIFLPNKIMLNKE